MRTAGATSCRRGFSLVELLVSLALVALLLLVMVSISSYTQSLWTHTTGRVSQFSQAREAFEAITRNLSQATLNTYLDYQYPNGSSGTPDTSQPPDGYTRQSELRFINGPAGNILTGSYSTTCPTHAVFFQAPLGSSDSAGVSSLNTLLNTCGYFIQFGDDSKLRPDFIKPGLVPSRYRFRLMEMVEPSESLSVYKYSNGQPAYSGLQWFNDPLGLSSPPLRVRAENIVALVILPKLALGDQTAGAIKYDDTTLAPHYYYSSTGLDSAGAKMKTCSDPNLNPTNQLPPVIQVTMVAVDEDSYNRLQTDAKMPDLGLQGLFTDAAKYKTDLEKLTDTLQKNKLDYRVFTSEISLKAAKWSRDQKN